jgi:FkbM family methyltransferase
LFPAAVIYCFEPFPESFAVLQAALAGDGGVRPFKLALADRAGEAVLNANVFPATNSLLATAPTAAEVWPGLVQTTGQVRVPTTTLDSFCREQSIDRIDVLKLDVQGAEPLVLRGGEGLLRSGRVRLVYAEVLTLPTYAGQAELHEFLSMMSGYGFELFNVYNPSATAAGQLRQVDAIFLPARRPEGA